MTLADPSTLTLSSLGHTLDTSPAAFGWLTPSGPRLDRVTELRARLAEDGYLYMNGYLDRDLVAAARQRHLELLDGMGMVDRRFPLEDGIALDPWTAKSCHKLIDENAPLRELLYAGRMITLYETLFGTDVKHFDFTWLRVMGPGHGTAPHCDSVYMGRGTKNLYTSWTPLGEVPLEVGGLMVMPGTNRMEKLVNNYCQRDVDSICTNMPERKPMDVHQWTGPAGDGKLSLDPAKLQRGLGRPWLTAEHWEQGDVLVFHIHTVHGSLDNHSNKIRLSSDTRYQPAAEPADERWIGAKPMGHGKAARKELIC